MTPTLIVLALLVLGVGIVVWAARRKPAHPPAEPGEADTAWNDPISPGEETGAIPPQPPQEQPRP